MRRGIVIFALALFPTTGGVAMAQRGWVVDPWQPGRPLGASLPAAPTAPERARYSYAEVVDPWPESAVARIAVPEVLPWNGRPRRPLAPPAPAVQRAEAPAPWARPPVEIVDPWPVSVSWAAETPWIVDPWN